MKIAWTYDPQRIIVTKPVVFTPDGKSVILGINEISARCIRDISKILLLDAVSGELLRSIDNIHVMMPTALAISWDGKWVATGTWTGTRSKTYNYKTRKIHTIDNKDPVRIWELDTGKLVKELPVHSGVSCLAFSRDGKYSSVLRLTIRPI